MSNKINIFAEQVVKRNQWDAKTTRVLVATYKLETLYASHFEQIKLPVNNRYSFHPSSLLSPPPPPLPPHSLTSFPFSFAISSHQWDWNTMLRDSISPEGVFVLLSEFVFADGNSNLTIPSPSNILQLLHKVT
jgi:hypothetical protein